MQPELVLYNPVSNAGRKRILPMSLLALGAVLEGRYDYRIVDGNCETDPLARLRAEVGAGANVLAVTVMPGPQLAAALPHCRALKRDHPSLQVVWGGYFPTQHAETVLRDPAVDFVVRGHGELVLLALLDALAGDRPCVDVPGLSYRRADSSVAVCPPAPVPDPESLPDFPYHRVDLRAYLRPTFLGARTLAHHSSYGCPFRCNFCAVVNLVDGRWLAQSPARVAAVARRYVHEFGVDAIEFYDSNFFAQESRAVEIAARLRPLRIAWWGEGRVDTLLKFSDRSWRALRASGLKMVFMGAESGSAETLRRMDKGGTAAPEKTVAVAAKMREHAIVPEFSFVLGSPPDPRADVEASLDLVRRLKKANPHSEIILYHYTPEPLAGELYDAATAAGFRFPRTLDEWVGDEWLRLSGRYGDSLPWLDSAICRRVRNFQRVLNAYYPTSTDARLTGARRVLLRTVSAWRYHCEFYHWPLELRALHRMLRYQRPETSGF